MLRIAIAPNAQFCESTIDILRSAGVQFPSNNTLIARSRQFPAEVFTLPYNEILHNVSNGIVDIGIVGDHHLINKDPNIEEVRHFPFASCNLSISLPKTTRYKGLEWLVGKKIATPFTDVLTNYLKSKNIRAQVIPISNLSSFIPEMGVADAVFDLVITGSTLLQHNLREVEVVMQTSPTLIAYKKMAPTQRMIFDELLVRIDAILEAKGKKSITMMVDTDKVDEIINMLIPNAEPAIIPLKSNNKCFITLITEESRVWDVLPRLKQMNVSNITFGSIDKIVL
ncbi:MAG: ATP phosphoribosyltransferase [Bacteroidales bacterium]|nr:ATP phosphoribosyltransferase [Bacteroidales bacterium]